MSPDEIKSRLKEKGFTQGRLARRWRRPHCTVNALVNRKFKSAKLETRLATLLGVSLEELRGIETKQ